MVLIIVGIILFSGNIDVVCNDTSFTIDPSYRNSITVNYGEIESIEYREGNVDGTRTWGFGSWKLLLGAFENEEFGSYTRYTYYKPEACIVVTCGDEILVFSCENAAETQTIYNELTARIAE